MATSSESKKNLPDGVEVVGEGAEDTSQRAYVGSGEPSKYPFIPEEGLRYVLVREHPEAWGMQSSFSHFESLGYSFVQFANARKTSAWYSLPQATYDKRKAAEKEQRQQSRSNARKMAKTHSESGGYETWVKEDQMVKGGALLPTPVVFNG